MLKVRNYILGLFILFSACTSRKADTELMRVLPQNAPDKLKAGLRMLNEAIEEDDDDPNLYFKRSHLFFEADFEESALKDINLAIDLDDTRSDYFYWKAYVLSRMGNYGTAQNVLDEADKLGLNNYEFHALKGYVLFHLNSYKNALDELNLSINQAPFFAEPYVYRGEIYNVMGDTVKAYANFEKAISLQKTLPEAYYFLSVTYLSQKKIKEAENAVRHGFFYTPDHYLMNLQKGNILLSQSLPDSAYKYLALSVSQKPALYEAEYSLGKIQLMKNNYYQAESYFQKVLKFKDDYKDTYFNLALCYEKTGKTNFAIDLLKKIISKDTAAITAKMELERINLSSQKDSVLHSQYLNSTSF